MQEWGNVKVALMYSIRSIINTPGSVANLYVFRKDLSTENHDPDYLLPIACSIHPIRASNRLIKTIFSHSLSPAML